MAALPLDFNKQFPLILAPMAGVTDIAYREICRAMGADFSFTEMVSAKGIHYGGAATARLLRTSPLERPAGVQLFASDPDILASTIRTITDGNNGEIVVIDINMGCPAHKIVSNGEGSALMKNLPLASRLIKAAVKASSLPVTVKFRKGFDEGSVNAVEFARMAEESGASMLTLHGRTREAMYSGSADWDIIAEVKSHSGIPVIGNGDVFSGDDAVRMLKHTACDGIMVARGAEGNPFIFNEIKAALNGEIWQKPTEAERIDKALEHAKLLVEYKGERAIIEMRKHVAWYVRGMRDATALRVSVNSAKTLEEMTALMKKYQSLFDS